MEADLEQVGIGCQPRLGLEAAQKVEPTHGGGAGELIQ